MVKDIFPMKPIGYIIVTYNRPTDILEQLKNISNLDKAAELLQEIIVVNNGSTDDYTLVKKYIEQEQNDLPFAWYDMPSNVGPGNGRNYAFEKSVAPYLIMIDDDAVLQNKDSLVKLLKEFETINTEREKVIVSFKVLYYDSLKMQKSTFPHKNYKIFKDKPFYETYYFVAGAHAIKREVFEKVGNYPKDFFYGMEEYDLSYRILNAGYSIGYTNQIVILHKESPLGRNPKKVQLRMMWVNKSKVAWKYLPKRYYYSTALLWSMQYLKETGFNIAGFWQGWKDIFAIPTSSKRTPINSATLDHIKKLKGRLWY